MVTENTKAGKMVAKLIAGDLLKLHKEAQAKKVPTEWASFFLPRGTRMVFLGEIHHPPEEVARKGHHPSPFLKVLVNGSIMWVVAFNCRLCTIGLKSRQLDTQGV